MNLSHKGNNPECSCGALPNVFQTGNIESSTAFKVDVLAMLYFSQWRLFGAGNLSWTELTAMSWHYHRQSSSHAALAREQSSRRECQCLIMNAVLLPLPSTPCSTLPQVKQQKRGRVRGKKRALRVESPWLQCSSQPLGEDSEVTVQLRVNLLAGRLRGSHHFHFAPIEIGQNKRVKAFDTRKTAVFYKWVWL